MEDKHLSLAELNATIRATLDENLAPTYWVVAEIGELRENQSGHCYLDLVEKEDTKTIAKIRGTIWSYQYRKLAPWFASMTGQPLRSGMEVLVLAEVRFHELYGISLNIRDIDVNYTLGERARRRQQVINQLTEEGVINMNRQLPLPPVPQRIAIISSPSAAGYGDFLDQLQGNAYNYHFHLKLFKAKMQGDEATESIINALHAIHDASEYQDDHYDLVVLIRGGGAQIDLDCFDSYEMNAHIAQLPIPVITGIGHERDETVADLVAHTSLKTPTAVAEFLIRGLRVFEEELITQARYLQRTVHNRVQLAKSGLQSASDRLRYSSKNQVQQAEQHTNRLKNQLKQNARLQLKSSEQALDTFHKIVELQNPERILARGYTLTIVNGSPAGKETAVQPGDTVKTVTSNQEIESIVQSSKKR